MNTPYTNMSKENTSAIRGIAAIIIAFCHIGMVNVQADNILAALEPLSTISVAVFWFYTGYTLLFCFIRDDSYMKGYLLKRLLRIYVPFCVAQFIYQMVQFFLMEGKWLGKKCLLLGTLGFPLQNKTTWYACYAIIVYLIFYVFFSIYRIIYRRTGMKDHSRIVLAILSLVVFMAYARLLPGFSYKIGALYGWQVHYPFPLLVGMLYAIFKNKIEEQISKYKHPIIVLMAATVFITYNRFNSGVSVMVVNEQVELYELVCVCLAPVLVNMICFCGDLNCKLCTWVGNISYEMYLFHMSFLMLWRSKKLYISNDYLFLLVYFVSLILFTWLFCYAWNKIQRKILYIFDRFMVGTK